MRRLLVFAGFLLGTSLCALAGDDEFAVSRISPAMLKDANAVVRVDDFTMEIINPGKVTYKQRFVVTILNEKGEEWAYYNEYYNRFRKINNIEGYLYDASGKQINKMKTKDAQDVSGSDEMSLIDDTRYKRFMFFYRVFPYTVEFSSEIESNSTLSFPGWSAQPGELLSVEKSSFRVICPSDYEFRFKSFNYPGEPFRESSGKTKTTTWKVQQVPAVKKEVFSPLWHEITTYVVVGPTVFRVADYSGNMSSWKEFGKFVYTLQAGRDELPPEVKQKVHQLTDHLKTPEEKISVLYKYLQKNTRYIGIQLGIGGWQPFDAKYVAQKAYGDCKALTNFMFSLLKEAGIRSHYSLVRAGKYDTYLTADFPSQQFDHVILCVPLSRDTTWLECTSQSLPAGYLGDFTGNRQALLIEEDGGQLVHTTRYDAKDNIQARSMDCILGEDGALHARSVTRYSGLQLDDVHSLINQLTKDKIKEYLQEQLNLATYDITRFSYQEDHSMHPVISEDLEIFVSSYATITGKRLFITPNILNRSSFKLPADESRKFDIDLPFGFHDIDSVKIQVPAGFNPESIPSAVKLNTPFGEYTNSFRLEGQQITYFRELLVKGGRFPASSYPDLVKFYENIYKADRARVVLVK